MLRQRAEGAGGEDACQTSRAFFKKNPKPQMTHTVRFVPVALPTN